MFLPKILAGEHIWCQGYSEPNAGSDLASLRTEAVLDGEHWVVNGQKIWTTFANDANWIFMLVRTDKSAKKQEGISFLLVPMDSPGITVRPIVNLDQHDEFCEVFFDNVRVPKDNLVGEVNKGWTMAKALLDFERIAIGSPKLSSYALGRLKLLAERMGVAEDPVFRDRYTALRLDLADLKALYETFAEKLKRGEPLGADVSMLKVFQSELFQRITDTMLEVAGENAGLLDPLDGNRALQRLRPVPAGAPDHDLRRLERDPARHSGEERAGTAVGHAITLSRSSASISSSPNSSSSRSTSPVCSPSSGGQRPYSIGVSEKRTGLATKGTVPATGCGISRSIWRCCTWRSAKTWPKSLIGPLATPTALKASIHSRALRVLKRSASMGMSTLLCSMRLRLVLKRASSASSG